MKKFNKIYKIKRREKTGRPWVIGFFAIFFGCLNYCSTDSFSPASQLIHLMIPLVPLFIAICLIHFYKAGGQLHIFNKFFSKVRLETKACVSILVMSIFLMIFLMMEDRELVTVKPLSLVIQCIAAVVAFALFDFLKIQRNNVEDEEVIEQAKHHVAPGLAMAYFRYIQNVVDGVVDEDGNEISKPHEDALRDYITENELESERVWISKKILILFPESQHIRGSVRDIATREKEKGENHCLTLEPVIHKYMVAGQPRKSVLDVIKIQDNMTTSHTRCSGKCRVSIGADRTRAPLGGLCEKLHEVVSWQNNYVIFAENRPLNTLYQMLETPGTQISFDRGDFELQFRLYLEELKKLIEKDEKCRDKVELFPYPDYTSKKGNFSLKLKNHIKKMKMSSS
jgi:hypothetical protein